MPNYSFKEALESEEFQARCHALQTDMERVALALTTAVTPILEGLARGLGAIANDPAIQRYMAARGYAITPRPYITTTRIAAHRPRRK